MPHKRERYLRATLNKVLGLSPLVGILGHRQVGKTTLLESIAKSYFTFDDADELLLAKKSAKKYLFERAGDKVALDECQTVEEIFPALKDWVRIHPKPGQFILSGSVRFTSRKAIQESLTGRIINLELLPLMISELQSKPLNNFWSYCIKSDRFSRDFFRNRSNNFAESIIKKYFENGGLPGVCFIRDSLLRSKKFNAQIETLIDRDLRMVVPTTLPYPQIRLLLQLFADRQGEPINWSELRSESNISIPTIKKLAYGFEAIFLLRSLNLEGDIKGPVYYFEDIGELNSIRQRKVNQDDQIAHFIINHIRGELTYSPTGQSFRLFQYRTRAGVVVPVCLEMLNEYIGIVPIEGQTPTRSQMAAGDSFLKKYNRSKVVFTGMRCQNKVINERRVIAALGVTI